MDESWLKKRRRSDQLPKETVGRRKIRRTNAGVEDRTKRGIAGGKI